MAICHQQFYRAEIDEASHPDLEPRAPVATNPSTLSPTTNSNDGVRARSLIRRAIRATGGVDLVSGARGGRGSMAEFTWA